MQRPRIAVLIPAYNEEENIARTLRSVLAQSIPPSLVLVGDNDSSDNTAEEAKKVLRDSGTRHAVIRVPRSPRLGKLNINNVYYALHRALQALRENIDYVATIEADVVLEKHYFEKLVKRLENDSRACIAGGRLEPLGLPKDPFPLDKPIHLWGGNRLYRATCWNELNNVIDIRMLPAWDTDHVIIATLLGRTVHQAPEAYSWTTRGIRRFTGYPKGWVDAKHGLPTWWALLKTIQYRLDTGYLAGYIAAKINSNDNHPVLRKIREIYSHAAHKTLIKKVAKILQR